MMIVSGVEDNVYHSILFKYIILPTLASVGLRSKTERKLPNK